LIGWFFYPKRYLRIPDRPLKKPDYGPIGPPFGRPRAAIGTVYFWGILQWHVTLSRNGHPSITALFFAVAKLSLSRLAWDKEKDILWIGAGLSADSAFILIRFSWPASRYWPCFSGSNGAWTAPAPGAAGRVWLSS